MLIKQLARGGVIAALYVVLTLPLGFAGLAYGPIQFRPSEALTVLPILFPEAVPALFVGVMLANTISQFGVVDIVFGSLITLAAAVVTRLARRSIVAYLSPVIFNALLVSIYVAAFTVDEWFSPKYWVMYSQTVLSIGISQALVVFGLGMPLIAYLRKNMGREF